MASEVLVRRTLENHLVPSLPEGIEAISKMKVGDEILVTVKTARKGWYHRRLFALLNFMYENFDGPTAEYMGKTVRQTRESHREVQLILAGHRTMDVIHDGAVRWVAKSISYASCSQEEIEPVYNNMLERVAEMLGFMQSSGETPQEFVEKYVDEYLRFAGLPTIGKLREA